MADIRKLNGDVPRKKDEIITLSCGCALYTDPEGNDRTSMCEEHKKAAAAKPDRNHLIVSDCIKWFERYSSMSERNFNVILRKHSYG